MKKDWTTGLKDKMSDYSERPSDNVWSGIAEQTGIEVPVREKRERLLPVWLWTSVAAAAAIMTGIFISLRHIQPELQDLTTMKVESISSIPVDTYIYEDVPAANNIEDYAKLPDDDTEMTETSADTAKPEKDIKNITTMSAGLENATEQSAAQSKKKSYDLEESEQSGAKTATDSKSYDSPTDEAIKADRKAWSEIISEDKMYKDGHEKKHGRHHASIAMSASGSGKKNGNESRPTALVLGSNPMSNGETVSSWIDPELMKHTGALTFNQAEVKTEYDHKIPVRMGLSARYGFGRFGIETGLTYSILSSDITIGEKGVTYSNGAQSLHYLGIPINLSFNIIDTRWFTMYAIAGGMGEKSVKGRLKTDEYENGNYVRSTNSSVNPKALQWSVNGALGFQVNIFEKLGFYMEPGVSHRFANNSKIRSSYTDKPTDFSLGFGLRYNFR